MSATQVNEACTYHFPLIDKRLRRCRLSSHSRILQLSVKRSNEPNHLIDWNGVPDNSRQHAHDDQRQQLQPQSTDRHHY